MKESVKSLRGSGLYKSEKEATDQLNFHRKCEVLRGGDVKLLENELEKFIDTVK